jgi:hypothetical protein
MTSREKINAALEDLKGRGVSKSSAAPPVYRLMWALGIHIPPPHFQSFLGLFALQGFFFGLIMTVVLFAILPTNEIEMLLLVGAGSGLVFGLLMATFMNIYKRKLGLPAWDDYTPGPTETEEELDW